MDSSFIPQVFSIKFLGVFMDHVAISKQVSKGIIRISSPITTPQQINHYYVPAYRAILPFHSASTSPLSSEKSHYQNFKISTLDTRTFTGTQVILHYSLMLCTCLQGFSALSIISLIFGETNEEHVELTSEINSNSYLCSLRATYNSPLFDLTGYLK